MKVFARLRALWRLAEYGADVRRIECGPNDVILIEVSQMLSRKACANIGRSVREVLGADRRVVVLDGDVKLRVLGQA